MLSLWRCRHCSLLSRPDLFQQPRRFFLAGEPAPLLNPSRGSFSSLLLRLPQQEQQQQQVQRWQSTQAQPPRTTTVRSLSSSPAAASTSQPQGGARFAPRRSVLRRPRPRLPPKRLPRNRYDSVWPTTHASSVPGHKDAASEGHTQSSSRLFPVSAIHIAQTIDLNPVMSELLARHSIRRHAFNKNSIIVQLPPEEEKAVVGVDGKAHLRPSSSSSSHHSDPSFVAVFRFGSVVCVNLSPRRVAALVADIKKKHAIEPVATGFERKENYSVLLRPPILDGDEYYDALYEGGHHGVGVDGDTVDTVISPTPTRIVTGDYCVVPELDMNGVSVISHIMAQTVALDTYNDVVDDLLAKFATINADVTKTGKFAGTNREFLFKTVAQNHIIFNDMISKIRIKDRSDTAWNLTKYEAIHYGMKDEFEIDDRFEHIEFKLNLIQQNAKFFVEVLQSQKSNTLEWIIVFLIAVECVIMTADMTGLGEKVISPLLQGLHLWTPAPTPEVVSGTAAAAEAASSGSPPAAP